MSESEHRGAARSSAARARLRALLAVTGMAAALLLTCAAPTRGAPIGPRGLSRLFANGTITSEVPESLFIAGPCDDASHVTWQVHYLSSHPPGGIAVYLLGGSAMRECIETPAALESAIHARCGKRTSVHVLGSSEQGYAQAIAMVENLPAGRAVIVVDIHHTPFAFGVQGAEAQLHGDELLLSSRKLHDLLERRFTESFDLSLDAGIKVYLAKYRRRRGLEAFESTVPISYNVHRYSQTMLWPYEMKVSRVALWRSGRGRPDGPFFNNFKLNAALLEEAVALARAKGYQVLLMETPLNAAIIGDGFDVYKSRYRHLCHDLVERYGAVYVNCNKTAGLVDLDFHDLAHLVPSGRVKWTPELARALVPLVRREAATAADPDATRPTPQPSMGHGMQSTASD